jgi:hypothetical protein
MYPLEADLSSRVQLNSTSTRTNNNGETDHAGRDHMQNPMIRILPLILLFGILATTTSAGEKAGGEKKTDPQAARAAEAALRRTVAGNINAVVAKLDISSAQRRKVNALTSEMQWKAAVKAFQTNRGDEIHNHAHEIVPQTIPVLMRKFMPTYMRSKIMASRQKGRRGPPSADEIATIQQDARNKIQPVMRKAVMPELDKLKQERVDELVKDEKTMTRVLADRIIKTEVLGKAGTKQFALALDEAGYPASLTSGADSVLNTRTKKMLNAIDLKKIVKAAGL